MQSTNQGGRSEGGQNAGKFPLDDLTYDLIAVIYEKSKGLEAYDKYQRDAQSDQQLSQLFDQIRRQDEQQIQQLRQHLQRVFGGQGTTGTSGSETNSMSQSAGSI